MTDRDEKIKTAINEGIDLAWHAPVDLARTPLYVEFLDASIAVIRDCVTRQVPDVTGVELTTAWSNVANEWGAWASSSRYAVSTTSSGPVRQDQPVLLHPPIHTST